MSGKLVILSGPSGAGKSTIAKRLVENKEFNLSFSVSACSRKKRVGEEHGKDYYFLSIDEFKTKIEENEFLEWEEVYPGNYYGTLRIEVEKHRSLGRNIIFDVDVVGGINIKRQYKENSISIFIQAPSLEILEQRLTARNTESPESLVKRVRKAKMEMTYARKYDHLVTNDNLETAVKEVAELVRGFLDS
jgi:guanylate kinase